jgi:hypothetical protein
VGAAYHETCGPTQPKSFFLFVLSGFLRPFVRGFGVSGRC